MQHFIFMYFLRFTLFVSEIIYCIIVIITAAGLARGVSKGKGRWGGGGQDYHGNEAVHKENDDGVAGRVQALGGNGVLMCSCKRQ